MVHSVCVVSRSRDVCGPYKCPISPITDLHPGRNVYLTSWFILFVLSFLTGSEKLWSGNYMMCPKSPVTHGPPPCPPLPRMTPLPCTPPLANVCHARPPCDTLPPCHTCPPCHTAPLPWTPPLPACPPLPHMLHSVRPRCFLTDHDAPPAMSVVPTCVQEPPSHIFKTSTLVGMYIPVQWFLRLASTHTAGCVWVGIMPYEASWSF